MGERREKGGGEGQREVKLGVSLVEWKQFGRVNWREYKTRKELVTMFSFF